MEKKIDQYNDFNGFSIKNLQQSIVFWRFLSAKNYFARSLSLNRQITEKRTIGMLGQCDKLMFLAFGSRGKFARRLQMMGK